MIICCRFPRRLRAGGLRAPCTPQWAETETGIEAARIVRLARELAEARAPCAVVSGLVHGPVRGHLRDHPRRLPHQRPARFHRSVRRNAHQPVSEGHHAPQTACGPVPRTRRADGGQRRMAAARPSAPGLRRRRHRRTVPVAHLSRCATTFCLRCPIRIRCAAAG